MKNNQKGNNKKNFNKGNKRNNENYMITFYKDTKNPFNKAADNMKAAKRKEILDRQSHNLEVIAAVEEYLSQRVKDAWDMMSVDRANGEPNPRPVRVKMQDVITALDPTYVAEDTIPVSQYTQILIELANAQMNTRISTERISLRIEYFYERLCTVFTDRSLDKTLVDLVDGNKYCVMYITPSSEPEVESEKAEMNDEENNNSQSDSEPEVEVEVTVDTPEEKSETDQ